jgi:hypothetical protein
MPTLEDFTLALRAYQQVQVEMGMRAPGEGEIAPRAVDAMQRAGPLPDQSVVFGIASDGLPLLLQLDSPITGPILLLADKGSGKTAFLQSLAQSAHRFSPTDQMAILVLTDFPEEWWSQEMPAHNFRVYPAYEQEAVDMLLRLAEWAESSYEQHSILLLFDGLDSILHMSDEGQQAFAFLLEHGPASRVWPVVAVNSARACKLPEWLTFFRTRIYGRIANPRVGDELTHRPGAPLDSLFPGTEFCMRHQSRWLRFWLPRF